MDFGGRAFAGAGWDLIGDGANGQDCHGHGTHVAATIGGNAVGVAKGATLQSVRVFNCYGKTGSGTFLRAVDLITAYVAGAAAIYLSVFPTSTPAAVRTVISNTATVGLLTGIGSTPRIACSTRCCGRRTSARGHETGESVPFRQPASGPLTWPTRA